MNNAIKKIELDLGGKIVSLTPEQAKNLKDALDDLFGNNIIKEKEYIPYPQPYPVQPLIYPYYWYWVHCDYPTTGSAIGELVGYYSGSETLRLTG